MYTGREITCGLGNQVHELWTVLTSKVSLTFGKGYGMVQTGKNKSSGELPYYKLIPVVTFAVLLTGIQKCISFFWVKVGIYIPLFLQQQKKKDYYSVLLIAKET